MGVIRDYGKVQFDILRSKFPDHVLLSEESKLLDLCDEFELQGVGYSGAVAEMMIPVFCSEYPSLLGDALRRILSFLPLTSVSDSDFYDTGNGIFQHCYIGALFKDMKRFGGRAYYLDSIHFRDGSSCFCGCVYEDDIYFRKVYSRNFVHFPFEPKTFYIDVVRVYGDKDVFESRGIDYFDINYDDGYCDYYFVKLKDSSDLGVVFDYYDRFKV